MVLVHADYVDMIHPPPSIQNKTSAPIGAWKCNSPPIKETIIVRPTDRRTHRQTETDRVIRKVTLPTTSSLCFGSWCLGYSNSDGLCNVLVRLNIVMCILHYSAQSDLYKLLCPSMCKYVFISVVMDVSLSACRSLEHL